jgi:hypothetical protein
MTDPFQHAFPHPTLTVLSKERPTPQTLLTLHQELNANAISFPSARGDGKLGHFALVVSPTTYLAASNGIHFIAPVHPGPLPTLPPEATEAEVTEIYRQYDDDVLEFSNYFSMRNILKKQLIAAVPDIYIYCLSDDQFGFAMISVLQLLEHLDITYGAMTYHQLSVNHDNLHRQWNGSQPIEDLWAQIRICRIIAADVEPISEATAVRVGFQNLENTGLFFEASRDWRKRPLVEWTLLNLQTDFNLANTERKQQLTAKSASYNDCRNVRTPAPPTVTPAAIPTTLYYCWSHGAGRNHQHTSETCQFPAPGHRTESTIGNMLGGCNTIQRRRGEIGIYRRTSQPK